MTTLTAKMNALVLSAKTVIEAEKDNPSLATALAVQSVARVATQTYGADKEGILSFARDTSLYLWEENFGPSKGYFFENVLNDFYAENNQRHVSNVIVDMYKQITLKAQFG